MVYYYEGVANLTEEEGAHEKAFYDALLPIMENQHESASLFFKEKYDKIVYVLKSVDEGKEAKQLKEEGYTQASAWARKYGIFSFGSSDVVVEKEVGVDIDVDHLKRPSYYERVFSDLKEIHHPDHPKGESFRKRVSAKYSNISRRVCKLFTDTCRRCNEQAKRKKPTAGVKNIITEGFGVRGQVDLVDYQSMPDGEFKFLLNYIDHGVKKLTSIPIVAKRASTVAFALFTIFTEQGPPQILQADNGREFFGSARDSNDRRVELDDEFMDDVIKEIKNLWPQVRLVRGSARHSESNGGVERVNQTSQKKIGAWMKDNNSTHWSIGCKLVQWQINTTMHMGIKGVPYELTYGQRPRVGISNLPVDKSIIDAIATEAQLNEIVALRPNELSSNDGDNAAVVLPAVSSTHNGVHTNSVSEEGVDAEAADDTNVSTLDTVDKCQYPDCPYHDSGPDLFQCEKRHGESRCPRKLHHLCQSEREMEAWRKHRPNVDAELAEGAVMNNPYQSGTMHICYDCHEHQDAIDALLDPDYGLKPSASAAQASSLSNVAEAVPVSTSCVQDIDDEEDVEWIKLVVDREGKEVTREELSKAALRNIFPCLSCSPEVDSNDPSNWKRVILQKVTRNEWDIFDESRMELLDSINWGSGRNSSPSPSGLYILWGTLYKYPLSSDIDLARKDAQEQRKRKRDQECEDDDFFSPRRKRQRRKASLNMRKQSDVMEARAEKADGGNYDIGDVVKIPLADVDRTKVDSAHIIGVVVEVTKHGLYRVASKSGVLQSSYAYHRLNPVTGVSNNRSIFGLDRSYQEWRGLNKITEREAARYDSSVGGQGMTKCNCKGKCDTRRCKCLNADPPRFCNSRCHKGNNKCQNCDKSDLFLPSNLKE